LEQIWNLIGISIGDLSSTIALAPAEELTLEFLTSQRRVLEQTRLDSAEQMDSVASTTLDKEVINTVQSLSKTQEWHVDGSATFGIPGKLSVSASGGFRRSTTETAQTTMEHTSEATNKSAHNLKTLHKIEVHGVSEGLVQQRLTRRIRNPYLDRPLSLNVFQLLKHFDVQTTLNEIRPAFLIEVRGFSFDGEFVLSNPDFLRDRLLDPGLIEELPIAQKGADPIPGEELERARAAAKLALHYLYDEVIIFNIKDDRPPLPRSGGGPSLDAPANSPEAGFDTGLNFTFPTGTANVLGFPVPGVVRGFVPESGLSDAVVNNLGGIFTTLAFFYKVYKDLQSQPDHDRLLDEQAIGIVMAINGFAGKQWSDILDGAKGHVDQLDDDNTANKVLRNILDNNSFTEIFRRLSGFVAMVNGMVVPIGGTTDSEKQAVRDQAEASRVLDRLLRHLRCNSNYYTQQFLAYRAGQTNNQALFDFVDDVIKRVSVVVPSLGSALGSFDLAHPFLDRQEVVIPGLNPLTEDDINALADAVGTQDDAFVFNDLTFPVLKNVQVPCDGVHLEVAGSDCKLTDLPKVPAFSLDLTVKDAAIKVESYQNHQYGNSETMSSER